MKILKFRWVAMIDCASAVIASVLLGLSGARAADPLAFLNGATVIESAHFTGEGNHTVTGKVDLVQKNAIHYLVLGKDFAFEGAPDPRLGFSREDIFLPMSLFSGLNRDHEMQIYRLPASLDPKNYDEITIWCDKLRLPLAEAKFERRDRSFTP